MDTGLEQEGGMGMPQVMEPQVGYPGLVKYLAKGVGYRARIQGPSVGIGEDEVILGELRAEQDGVGLGLYPLVSKDLDQRG